LPSPLGRLPFAAITAASRPGFEKHIHPIFGEGPMRRTFVLGTRAWKALALVAAATLLAGTGTSDLYAQEASIVKVEEEWELVVSQVDANLSAPQVTVVISPLGHLDGLYSVFELNHQSQPSYVGGGVQLQVWNANEVPAATRKQHDGVNLANANEVVTWTQIMELSGGLITFDVDDGVSTSWGTFGQGVIASVTTTLTDLNAYNPLVSVNNSGPGFASNRVTSLKLKKVRVHLSTGQVVEDSTEKVAFPKP
jgi:hypothetical protein